MNSRVYAHRTGKLEKRPPGRFFFIARISKGRPWTAFKVIVVELLRGSSVFALDELELLFVYELGEQLIS